MDEVLSIRPITSSVEQLGLIIHDEFLKKESEKRTMNASLETVQNSLTLTSKMKVFLRLRSLTPKLNSNAEDQDEIFVVLNSRNLLTKIPIADGTSSRRSKQPNSVETQNIRKYTFSSIFTPEVSQQQLFESTKQNIVEFLSGQSSTIMSYGTTNSGKTYTLFGNNTSPGIIPNSINYIFSKIDCSLTPWYKPTYGNNVVCLDETDRILEVDAREKLISCRLINKTQSSETFMKLEESNFKEESRFSDGFFYSIWLSFIEIYNETIFDLLAVDDEGRNMQLKLVTDKSGNTCLKGLRMVSVSTSLEAFQIMLAGKSRLSVASTAMNSKSSRSHSIFTMILMKYSKESDPEEVTISSLKFCDLAGTGGLRKTSDIQRVKEARSINASLLVLGRCLKSVREGQSSRQSIGINGPFRESNLTRMFQKALSGKENITLLVNINPTPELYVETQSVLNFSSLAKKVNLESAKQLRRSTDSQLTVRSSKWDTSLLPSIPQTPVKTDKIYEKSFEDLKEQNQALLKELSTLKTSALDKEFEIREELSQFYSSMMKDLEENWRKKYQEIEVEQKDLLKWSVNQVEDFYKERIDNITNRKRRRLSSGDHGDFDRSTLETLEEENAEATSKILSQKQVIENLRKKNEELGAQKSEFLFQLAITKKELKDLKELRRMNESINIEEEDNSVNRGRESFLFEFNEYWAKTTDLEEKLKEKTDLIHYLKNQLEEKEAEIFAMRDKWQKAETRGLIASRKVEELEAKLRDIPSSSFERPSEDRIIASSNVKMPSDSSSPDSMYKISMIEAESSLIDDYETPELCLKTLVRVPTLVPFELPEDSRLSFLDSSADKSVKSGPRSSEASGKDDSGILISSGSQRSSELNKIETDDKCSQVNIVQEEDIERIRERLESLKLEYGKLKTDYSSESSKAIELEVELISVRKSIMALEENCNFSKEKEADYESRLASKNEDLKRLSADKKQIEMRYNDVFKKLKLKSKEYEMKLDELYSSLEMREENGTRASKCLDEYIEKSASLESQLADARAQLEKSNIKCATEHVPKIDRLEKELFEKTLRVRELDGKMSEVERDLVRIAELNEKVKEFEEVLERCQKEKEDLRKQSQERSEDQSSLESKLKKLMMKVQERESEVLHLQTTLEQMKNANSVNSERADALSKEISESLLRVGNIKSELMRSEEARKELEWVSKEEVGFLRSRLSTFEKHGAFLSMICKKNENNEEEVNRLKLELCEKEREINLFKKNRDATILKYESMVRQLQLDVEKTKQARKIFPARKASKEFPRSNSESRKNKIGKSEIGASSKISSTQMANSSSLESISKADESTNRSVKIAAKKESQKASRCWK
ncbi:kinesin-like protein KIF20A isoform X2 [Belonocnema kinseyi]|uniref:kinesin-like protein KIF20A isoform X2 n=1 Tax=Belonocnema kinseyi TaxID=2817044 RepID=UPI00143D1B53|nr:kinesin-like protein KIF20A isoform X2 [Belonocnema kinseyi]